jgi:hypothetical protein
MRVLAKYGLYQMRVQPGCVDTDPIFIIICKSCYFTSCFLVVARGIAATSDDYKLISLFYFLDYQFAEIAQKLPIDSSFWNYQGAAE